MSAASLMQVGVLGCQSIAGILLDDECTHQVPVSKSPRLPCACSEKRHASIAQAKQSHRL